MNRLSRCFRRLSNRRLLRSAGCCVLAMALAEVRADWPVLATYSNDTLRCVKMPIGGIGTGTISLSGIGGLVDWEIRNSPEKGFVPCQSAVHPAFVIRTEGPKGIAMRLLEGPIDHSDYEGAMGTTAPNHGYPRFAHCSFLAAYPLAQVRLSDPALPVKVVLEALNPLVPGDAEASGLPVALMRWRVTNLSDAPLKVTLATAIPNPAAGELSHRAFSEGRLRGLEFKGESDSVEQVDSRVGEFVIAVPEAAGEVSVATDFRDFGWGDVLDGFWRRLHEQGDVADAPDAHGTVAAVGELAVSVELVPNEDRAIPFVFAWRFPHRRAWLTDGASVGPSVPFPKDEDVGNWYCRCYSRAVDAAIAFCSRLPELEEKTIRFVRAVAGAPAPHVVREAALFNVSTLRTQTCFRTADGHFFGWEGCFDNFGSCFGSCAHVWGYEHALVDLWPALAKDMVNLQFHQALRDDGLICFRIGLPLSKHAKGFAYGAADGQMQCIVKAYECWKKTGDEAWARDLYPQVRKALQFSWLPGGWDADRDGVIEGCQHNTMDVNYYGPNPQMEFLYLAALKSAAEFATLAGDVAFAEDCRALAMRGAAWTEQNLFNGAYYEHRVRSGNGDYLQGTCFEERSRDLAHPDYQLANGCLVDQLLGDYAARAVGLGPVADESHARKTMETILRCNRREPNRPAFNPMRDFVLADERALRMAWYPDGALPEKPFPYYRETMTGFEYVAAAELALLGERGAAEEVVRDIRARYDGKKRNPFDEAECGHHYARALVSWTVFRAFVGNPSTPFLKD